MDREKYTLANLHPIMVGPTMALTRALLAEVFTSEKGERFALRPFEGFRHPARQGHLFAGGKVTKSRPWQSPHQYGLAVDFAGVRVDDGDGIIPNSWTWDFVPESGWRRLKALAAVHGLDVPISWDKGHVVHPNFEKMKQQLNLFEWNWIG